jgi:hypothetical protein
MSVGQAANSNLDPGECDKNFQGNETSRIETGRVGSSIPLAGPTPESREHNREFIFTSDLVIVDRPPGKVQPWPAGVV